jgi:hypothetical protein
MELVEETPVQEALIEETAEPEPSTPAEPEA